MSAVLLSGCQQGVLDPAGPVGRGERLILFDALAIMLSIVLPTMLAIIAMAWWFRSSNRRARYRPHWSYSGQLELLVWSVPALVVLFLGGLAWIGAHDLDPAKSLQGAAQPLEIEVVALDWKWLFIYPAQGIASVNQLTIPAGQPVHFRLTSATVMNSFFVPQLGSQIYAMAGMTTQLNLQADRIGEYPGIAAQFSGDGFSDMRFHVSAVSADDFARWVTATHAAGATLDHAAYDALAKPSQAVAVSTYRAVAADLFQTILQISAPSGHQPATMAAIAGAPAAAAAAGLDQPGR